MEMGVHHTVIFVLIIIIACNAVLYPSLFSTIFRVLFGYPAPKEETEPLPEYPPHMRGRMHPGGRSAPPSGDAAGYMSRHRQESSGPGIMTTILPVYALGIFLYFGYVIYKIFLKPKPGTSETDPWAYADEEGPSLERQQEENLQRQLAAELRAANYDGMGGNRRHRSAEQQQSTQENGQSGSPSPRADASDVDLLKMRLEQTEQTMDKMMAMMNNMGVAFNRVTERLNINAGVPVGSETPAKDQEVEEEDGTSEDGEEEASWTEGSEILEGERLSEGGLEDLDGEPGLGKDFGDLGMEESGCRIEDLAKEGSGEVDSSVRRRKVTGEEAGED